MERLLGVIRAAGIYYLSAYSLFLNSGRTVKCYQSRLRIIQDEHHVMSCCTVDGCRYIRALLSCKMQCFQIMAHLCFHL